MRTVGEIQENDAKENEEGERKMQQENGKPRGRDETRDGEREWERERAMGHE